MCVCIGDLGNAVFGSPEERPPSRTSAKDVGIEAVTLYYRAPEILLGMAAFSYPVDMWALGCTAAEMLLRTPLFRGDSQVDMLRLTFELFGKPPGGTLVRLPSFSSHSPSFAPQPWPPERLRSADWPPRFADFVRAALEMDPLRRISAADAGKHDFFQLQRFRVECAECPTGRGR